MVGRPGSSSGPGLALRPRATTTDTKAFGAHASVMGNLSVVDPSVRVSRRCSMIPSRSTVTHASAPVNGEAKSTVAVSPTLYRCRSAIRSILNWLSSFHGTQPLPVAQRKMLVSTVRWASSSAVKLMV